nr:hypothetical protein [Desulfurispirillum indicum]
MMQALPWKEKQVLGKKPLPENFRFGSIMPLTRPESKSSRLTWKLAKMNSMSGKNWLNKNSSS